MQGSAFRALVIAAGLLAAVPGCERASPQPAAETKPAEAKPVGTKPAEDPAQVAADVQRAMTELLAYSDTVFAILRAHGRDCDETARLLEARAAVFRELGPRMMKVKAALQALPEPAQAEIKHATETAMQAFQARNPDVEALEQAAKACEKTSPAFAAIAPKVMFTKKR